MPSTSTGFPCPNSSIGAVTKQGQLAIAEGRLDKGIALLTQYRDLYPVHRASARATVALSGALARRGRTAEAIGILEQLSKRRLEFIDEQLSEGFAWLSVRDVLAELYHHDGRLADAKAVDDELETLLAVADEDHPIKRRIGLRAADSRSPRQ